MSQIVVHDAVNATPDASRWSWHRSGIGNCTAATLIEERIRSESDRVRAGHAASVFHSELTDGEDLLIDKLVARALLAFDRGKLLLIVNDRQVHDREATINIVERLDVIFLRLMPLKGG